VAHLLGSSEGEFEDTVCLTQVFFFSRFLTSQQKHLHFLTRKNMDVLPRLRHALALADYNFFLVSQMKSQL